MVGGLLNLISYGEANIILNGNPKKTFFKTTYNQYTNFGMQRFRIDYEGQRRLHYENDSEMIFTIPRYGDLLFDTYVVVTLPNIWSPLWWLGDIPTEIQGDIFGINPGNYSPFEFRWIENLGAQMIREITIYSGGNILAQYPGEWLYMMKERDFNKDKKELWNSMTGHSKEFYAPDDVFGRINVYPNTVYDTCSNIIEPSIRGRQLYIPIDAWFCSSGKTTFPLVSLQYQELKIKITFRPIYELFKIRDVTDISNNYPIQSPKLLTQFNNIWRFLSPPNDISQNYPGMLPYPNARNEWDADIHLLANYVFLGNEEQRLFAQKEQTYLLKEVHAFDFLNITGSSTIEMHNRNMVSSYMWRLRRSDAHLRNEWSNYSNWAYDTLLPFNPENQDMHHDPSSVVGIISEDIFYYKNTHVENIHTILIDMAILIDGKYREDVFSAGMWNYVEKYIRTTGNAKQGIYCYNFCLNSNHRDYQPTGAMNMNKFKNINFEINTIQPPPSNNRSFNVICDGSGEIIGVRKQLWKQNEYNFDMRVFEERYNIIHFTGGMCGLMYVR